MMRFIIEAVPQENYILKLIFRTGETRLLDMKPYIQKGGVFGRLRDDSKFRDVQVQEDLGGLVWPSGADFCPNTAFLKSEPYVSDFRPSKRREKGGRAAQVLERLKSTRSKR